MAFKKGIAYVTTEVSSNRNAFHIEEHVTGAKLPFKMIIYSASYVGAFFSSVRDENAFSLASMAIFGTGMDRINECIKGPFIIGIGQYKVLESGERRGDDIIINRLHENWKNALVQ